MYRLAFLLLLLPYPASAQDAPDSTFLRVFDDVWEAVNQHFYDPDFNGVDWPALRETYEPRAVAAPSKEVFAQVVNEMLGRLGTSHTHFYTDLDPAYYQLLDIFGPALGDAVQAEFPDGIRYPGIGVFTEEIDGAVFVRGVLEGGPAHAAGLLMGDRLLAADSQPFHPIRSFEGKTGRTVRLRAQRAPHPDSVLTLHVTPEMIQPGEMLREAMAQSITVIEQAGQRIGYVHAWSFAGEQYYELLQQEVAFGALKDADALVLDLRDGWGGASPTYLNLFNPSVPRLTQTGRGGEGNTFDFQWRKPVALLVNEGSRSGKEILAYGFKAYDLGPVVGTRTAGAVVGGRPFHLAPGMLLYLAVADVLVDGERLEGRGVAPDIDVPFALPYAAGTDPQLEAAVDVLVKRLAQ